MMQNTGPKSESLADNFEAGCILHICCVWRSGTWIFCFTAAKAANHKGRAVLFVDSTFLSFSRPVANPSPCLSISVLPWELCFWCEPVWLDQPKWSGHLKCSNTRDVVWLLMTRFYTYRLERAALQVKHGHCLLFEWVLALQHKKNAIYLCLIFSLRSRQNLAQGHWQHLCWFVPT